MRVLITEDNREVAHFIQEGLGRAGFLSDIASSARAFQLQLKRAQYAAIILDLGLPDKDGMVILDDLRRAGVMVPVLILTARGGVQDRITGLNGGADDYLTKPFSIDELVARIRALLRRPSVMSENKMQHKNISIELINKTVMVNDVNVILGKTEFAVLEHMMRNVGLTISKESLEDSIYQNGYEITDNALQVAIHRVRKKLKAMDAHATMTAIRGIGYIFQ